jgi:hypothetical protein
MSIAEADTKEKEMVSLLFVECVLKLNTGLSYNAHTAMCMQFMVFII